MDDSTMEAMRGLGSLAGMVNLRAREVDSNCDTGNGSKLVIGGLDPRAAEHAMRVALSTGRQVLPPSPPPPPQSSEIGGYGVPGAGYVDGGPPPPSRSTMIPMPDDLKDRLAGGWNDPVFGTPAGVSSNPVNNVQPALPPRSVPPSVLPAGVPPVDEDRWNQLFEYLEVIKNILEYMATPADGGAGDESRGSFPKHHTTAGGEESSAMPSDKDTGAF